MTPKPEGLGGAEGKQAPLKSLGILGRPAPNPTNHPTDRQKLRLRRLLPQLERIFNRQPGAWSPRDYAADSRSLLWPLLNGGLRVRMTHLPASVCRKAAKMRAWGAANESYEHLALKAAGLAWMEHQRVKDARYEAWSPVGKSDVYSVKRTWIIECGHTEINKLRTAVGYPRPLRFTLIPYQHLTTHQGNPRRLIALDFEWDREVSAAVNRAENEAALLALGVADAAPKWSTDALELDEDARLPVPTSFDGGL